MGATAQDLPVAFQALSPEEKHLVSTEILRRSATSEPLSEAALYELAAELFRG